VLKDLQEGAAKLLLTPTPIILKPDEPPTNFDLLSQPFDALWLAVAVSKIRNASFSSSEWAFDPSYATAIRRTGSMAVEIAECFLKHSYTIGEYATGVKGAARAEGAGGEDSATSRLKKAMVLLMKKPSLFLIPRMLKDCQLGFEYGSDGKKKKVLLTSAIFIEAAQVLEAEGLGHYLLVPCVKEVRPGKFETNGGAPTALFIKKGVGEPYLNACDVDALTRVELTVDGANAAITALEHTSFAVSKTVDLHEAYTDVFAALAFQIKRMDLFIGTISTTFKTMFDAVKAEHVGDGTKPGFVSALDATKHLMQLLLLAKEKNGVNCGTLDDIHVPPAPAARAALAALNTPNVDGRTGFPDGENVPPQE